MTNPASPTRILALAALVLAAACTDRTPTDIAGAPPAGREVRTEIACTVVVAQAAVRCGEAGPAGSGAQDLIMGGQGTYVRLESGNAAYDSAAAEFSLDVTVQNLLSLRMGTPDGTTATGTRVFFEQMPTATAGSGEIAVVNPDGTGSFTRIGQPYFAYPEILEARGSSAPRTWRFDVPGTVERFSFTVYVHTALPAEEGVLRWLQEEGPAANPVTHVRALWGASSRDVFAVGMAGRILHYDGSRWAVQPSGTSVPLQGVWGTSRSDVYAVGDSGTVLHYDGNRWTRLQGNVSERYLKALWGRGDTLYVAGHQRDASFKHRGLVMRSTDGGETWEEDVTEAAAGHRLLWGVYGGDAGHVYVSGQQTNTVTGVPEAVILKTEDGGATWTEVVLAESTSRGLNRVWAQGQHVFAAGFAGSQGLVVRSSDGGATWTQQVVPQTGALVGVWGFSPTDVTMVGAGGRVAHWDGSGWSSVGPGGAAGLQGVWGSSPSDLWAGGDSETFARNTGSGWTVVTGPDRWDHNYGAVWGTGPGDLFVVSRWLDNTFTVGTALLRRTAQGWTTERPWERKLELTGIWGTGTGTVIVTGTRHNEAMARHEGVILRNDGSGWTETVIVGGDSRRLNSVHGDGAGNVWIAGNGTGAQAGSVEDALVLHSTNNGGSWTETAIPLPGYTLQLFDVWASGPGAVHAVGTAYSFTTGRATAFRVRYDGSAWTHVVADSTSGLNTVWGTGGTIFAAGYARSGLAQKGLVLASTDGGATFEPTEFAPTVGSYRTFVAAWGASPTSMYVVGTGGGILHFDGTRWEESGAAANTSLFGLWGFSESDVYAVGANQTVLHGIR
jgi:hypothetical protein